ncbi:MAG: ATP synthase F0 subunit A [Puniceicoccaceae bacterium]|nr:ATP synthase F0 subunit A [Puniceicoccaceae bacterium]
MKQILTVLLFSPLSVVFGADSSGKSVGVSPYAYEIEEFSEKLFNLPVTNAILTTWVVSIIFILVVRFAVGKPSLIPNKAQLVLETLIEGLKGLLEPILGKKAFPQAFPLLLGFFVFILIHNWSGLLPGIGVFGFYDAQGHLNYWLRPASSDLNAALGLALIAMIAWAYLTIKVSGIKFFLWELFGNKASKKETPAPIYLMLTPIFILVGFIEVISIAFRPVSLSFRLFGNVYGGENLLTSMTGLVPYLLPIPFYFYEILVGVVQALIFTLLVAIYIGLITNHGEEH